ncbi:hypothetical protein [Phytohabitans rumicis]|uniref:Uncharacterized protein n=1 Tax=Phytohabitans rumicis TaxID=1076125 RepID=A0A6V8KXQ4_9ACTN|nr:hypothetical protein [Phytohabitans rumicis]GFJ89872.1 hypothetical protein Prum_035140 [Phytohabitans rumicis]
MRRRRQVTAATLAAVAVVLVVAPVAGFAALSRDSHPGPAPAESGSPTPSVPPTPTATPPATPSAVPDGRISRAQLLAATVTLPRWQSGAPASCLTKNVRLAGSKTSSKPWLGAVIHGDADGDGAEETVATLACSPGNTDMQQVVVFDRDKAGRIVTLGQVVRTGDEIGWLIEAAVSGPRTVRVQVGDVQPCCDVDEEQIQKQTRTYVWNGTGFQQTGWPTAFTGNPNSTDLSVEVTDLVLTPNAADGRLHGTITVNVRNLGPQDAERVDVTFGFDREVRHEGTGWDTCQGEVEPGPRCQLFGIVHAGERRTCVFEFSMEATAPFNGTATVQVSGMNAVGTFVPDLAKANNRLSFDYRRK